MGTKVYLKSQPAGYHPMRDPNENATSAWPFYYEDGTLTGQFCNGFMSRPVNGYSEYDKELLKQTMLRHEEIFRKQVLELHRLYRIQRDMMVELKRKGEQFFSVQMQPSQPSPFSTQISTENTGKPWQDHALPLMNTRYIFSGANNAHSHLSSSNETSFKSGPVPKENEGPQGGNQVLDSKPRKIPRRLFDLQLPAEAYMENDDAEDADEKYVIKPPGDFSSRYCGLKPEDDVNLILGTAQNASSEIKKSSSHLRNGLHFHKLGDLNEPLKEVSCEEVAVSSRPFSFQTTTPKGLEGHQKSLKSASSFLGLRKDLFHDRNKGAEIESVFLSKDRGERRQKWPFCNIEIAQSSNHAKSVTSSLNGKDVQPFEPVIVGPKKAHNFLTIIPPKQSETEAWLREKSSQIIELSDDTVNTNYSGLMVPTTSVPLALSCTDYAKTSSTIVTSWRNSLHCVSHSPVEIPTFSSFGRSMPMHIQSRSSSTSSQNLGNAKEKWQCNRDFRSTIFGRENCIPNGLHQGLLSESSASSHVGLPPISFDKPAVNSGVVSSYETSKCHGHQEWLKGLHHTDARTVTGINLNLAPPNEFMNELSPQQRMLIDVEGKKESLSGEIPWLRTKSTCIEPININKGAPRKEFDIVQGCSEMMSTCCALTSGIGQKDKTEGSPVHLLQDFTSNLRAGETNIEQESSVSSSCKRIVGFAIPQCSKISFTSISHKEIYPSDDAKRVKEEFLQSNPSCLGELLDSDKQIHVEQVLVKGLAKSIDHLREDINLNSCAISIDQTNSPPISSKDEVEILSLVSVQGTAKRVVSEIKLEAPVTSLSEEQIPSVESASCSSQIVLMVEPDSERGDPQAMDIGDETLVRMAAETIHIISLDKPLHLEDITLHPLSTGSANTLHWFADVVTYNADDLENILGRLQGDGDGSQESSDVDGMDYFEYMTLKLEETKVDEYCCGHLEREIRKEEETGAAHLLTIKPRRGQGRKRRQRRDFQKDILPGLASLSRYEVTEDLQMIGGLMRASGQLWQHCGARRNTGRNRSRCQAKGTRQQRGNAAAAAAAAAVEISEDNQPRQPSGTQIETGVRSFLGWGRTTRRCQRQRCSSGNILASPPSEAAQRAL